MWSTKRMCNGPGEWDKVAYYELWKTSLLGKTTIQMKRRIYDDDADTYSLMAVSDGNYDIDVAASSGLVTLTLGMIILYFPIMLMIHVLMRMWCSQEWINANHKLPNMLSWMTILF